MTQISNKIKNATEKIVTICKWIKRHQNRNDLVCKDL